MLDDILSYREMCDAENTQTLQRGMNFKLNPSYSVILMSRRTNAPYRDKVLEDGITIEYEGHDAPKNDPSINPKEIDQPKCNNNGSFTQNGLFIKAAENYKNKNSSAELVKIYEKILPGVWSLKGFFDLIDYRTENDGSRNVFVFILRLSPNQSLNINRPVDLEHSRL